MLKEIYTYRYPIIFGLSSIIGFLSGILVGLSSINHP